MRSTSRLFMLGLLLCSFVSISAAPATPAKPGDNLEPEAPQWKGKPSPNSFQIGGQAGLGTFAGRTGFSLYGAVSYKILNQGFVDDINDQAFLEVTGGPIFIAANVGWVVNMHLRWDFHKNDMWSFFATGGVGTEFSGLGLGNVAMLYPRFGAGVYWNLFEFLSFRADVSHEFAGLGILYLL